MKYGFSTGFATEELFKIDFDYIDKVSVSRFDFVDLPIAGLANLNKDDLARLVDLDLELPCACNMFPGSVKIFDTPDNHCAFFKYLDNVFEKIYKLGIKNIAFGSPQTRMMPPTWEYEKTLDEFLDITTNIICPYLQDGIKVLIEPLNTIECNFINTIEEGLSIVKEINNDKIKLIADLLHMQINNEDSSVFTKALDSIEHVHLCGLDRVLPEDNFTPYMDEALHLLKSLGYNKTISYESKDGNLNKACQLLHNIFEN